jgi:hypothetical protein
MGVKGIVELAEKLVPEAWSHTRADAKTWNDFVHRRFQQEGCGEAEDCLTRINRLPSPRHNDSFTGLELMDAFFKDVAKEMAERNCRFYWCTFDYQAKVPKEKWETQQARSSRAKKADYPKGTKIVDSGVLLPDADEPELLDLRRFGASRSTRESAWEFFKDNVYRVSHFRRFPLPPTQVLVIEYLSNGPYVFTVDPDTGGFGRPVHRPDLAHEHGEGDPSVWDAANQHLPGRNSIIHTTDSDILPLGGFRIQHRLSKKESDKGEILWRTNRGKTKDVHADLRVLIPGLLSALEMTPVSFAFFCCLLGSDYCAKNLSTHWIGLPAIQAAVTRYSDSIDRLWGRKLEVPISEAQRTARLENLKEVLYRIYWYEDKHLEELFRKHKSLFARRPKDWDELFAQSRPVLMAEKKRQEEEEAKPKSKAKGKGKKRKLEEEKSGKDEVEEAKPKRKGAKRLLNPPNPATLNLLVDRITFTIDYWRGWTNPVMRKFYFPGSSGGSSTSTSSSSSSSG